MNSAFVGMVYSLRSDQAFHFQNNWIRTLYLTRFIFTRLYRDMQDSCSVYGTTNALVSVRALTIVNSANISARWIYAAPPTDQTIGSKFDVTPVSGTRENRGYPRSRRSTPSGREFRRAKPVLTEWCGSNA